MAIEVGCQLETIGRTVNLCLLDSTPSVIQSWLRMIGPPNTSEFDEKLLYILLNLSVKVSWKHIKYEIRTDPDPNTSSRLV